MILNLNKNTIQSIMKSADKDEFMQKRATVFSGSELKQYHESPTKKPFSEIEKSLRRDKVKEYRN